jgi:hypothetical protein
LDESKDENENCIDSFKNKSGFHQNFNYLFENSHTDVEDRSKFFQSNPSYDDDIKIISLASQVSFFGQNLLYCFSLTL